MANIKTNEASRVAHILSVLESSKKVKQGNVSFEGWGFTSDRVFISRMIKVDDKIPEIDKNNLISESIFEASKNGQLNNASFIRSLSYNENKYLNMPFKKFRMVGQLSLMSSLCSSHLNILDSRITFGLSRNSQLYRKHKNATQHVERGNVPAQPLKYTPFSVSCMARTSTHAFDIAGRTFELWRGCFNLGINRSRTWRITFDGRNPINALLAHPVYTIHEPNGELASDSWYYDSTYQTEGALINQYEIANQGRKCFEILRKKLYSHPYSDVVINAITRYVRALDHVSYEMAFIQLWSICESLTLTTRTESKRTVKLIKAMYHDGDRVDVILQILLEFRNRTVHFGEHSQDIEFLLFHIKNLVEDLIFFHAFNRYSLNSLEESVNFLDLGLNIENLSMKEALLKKAIKRAMRN